MSAKRIFKKVQTPLAINRASEDDLAQMRALSDAHQLIPGILGRIMSNDITVRHVDTDAMPEELMKVVHPIVFKWESAACRYQWVLS
jgi:hypothetical protein